MSLRLDILRGACDKSTVLVRKRGVASAATRQAAAGIPGPWLPVQPWRGWDCLCLPAALWSCRPVGRWSWQGDTLLFPCVWTRLGDCEQGDWCEREEDGGPSPNDMPMHRLTVFRSIVLLIITENHEMPLDSVNNKGRP
jgi:hypothetical protein